MQLQNIVEYDSLSGILKEDVGFAPEMQLNQRLKQIPSNVFSSLIDRLLFARFGYLKITEVEATI